MKKQAILFKTHFITSEILKEYENLKSSCDNSIYDVFLLYDNSRNDFNTKNINSFLFTLDDIKKLNYQSIEEYKEFHSYPQFWFHADYPVLFFFNSYPEYDYYWQIEFDVRFNGDWNYFFGRFENDNSDLLSTNICFKKEEEEWCMWNLHNLNIDEGKLIKNFFPIIRISNRSLHLIDEKYKEGLMGYCELIVSTILNLYGYTIKDIDHRFYTDSTLRFKYPTSPFLYGLIRYIPNYRNKLFHPIREQTFMESLYSLFRIHSLLGKFGKVIKVKMPSVYRFLKPFFPDKK